MVILLKVIGFEGEHFSALDYHSAESVPAMCARFDGGASR
jgi:hypothetical protein